MLFRSRGFVFFGAPYFYPWPYPTYFPPPYYYGPDYSQPRYDPPTVYVEKFSGTPTPQTQGEIFCPDKRGYYPVVQDCPGGWQRVTHMGAPGRAN